MAKVTLPFLSGGAVGMFARQVVYQMRGGQTLARAWRGKRDARSAAEVAVRDRFRFAVGVWPDLNPLLLASLEEAAAESGLTAWNEFVRRVELEVIGAWTVGSSIVGGADLISPP